MSEEVTGGSSGSPRKRRVIWTETRRLSLVKVLLTEPENTQVMFDEFRKLEKYRGLTKDRVIREARALVNAATSEENENFYILKMPPPKPRAKKKTVTVQDKRRAAIMQLAQMMPAAQREALLKAKKEEAKNKGKKKPSKKKVGA